jgi:hypothetical protein
MNKLLRVSIVTRCGCQNSAQIVTYYSYNRNPLHLVQQLHLKGHPYYLAFFPGVRTSLPIAKRLDAS